MKKFYLITLTLLLATGYSFAQQLFSDKKVSDEKDRSFVTTSQSNNSIRNGKANYIVETFDTEIPDTWTITTDATAVATWEWEAGYATIDSDAAGSGAGLVAGHLYTPIVDVSAEAGLLLAFDHYYRHLGSSYATVEVFDGEDWQLLVTYSASSADMDHVEFDVTDYINENFQVRFYYNDASGWNWWWRIDNVAVFSPEENDLGVVDIVPTFILSGNTVTPKVSIKNFGSNSQSVWSVTLTDGDTYTSTKEDITTIDFGSTLEVDMDDWTPLDGTYSLTATVTLADDGNLDNNELTVECVVDNHIAFAGNTTDGVYAAISLANGNLTPMGSIGSSPFPMAEEYNGTHIYRIYNDLGFGTVDPTTGTYTQLGIMSGAAGTPTGLAWDWYNETMYVLVLNASNLPQLCTLDLETFVLTVIGTGTEGMIIGIDFANDGYIYGPSLDNDTFYSIDPETGATTSIGPIGFDANYGQDVSYNAQTGQMYSITCGSVYKFGTYNLETGAFTEIADMNGKQYGTFVITTSGKPFEVIFVVTDGTSPIEDATVLINEGVYQTDADGEASLELFSGTYYWEATKDGYTIVTGTLDVENTEVTIDVTLLPAADLSLTVKMRVWHEEEKFDPETDFVDVAGTFNGWGATAMVLDAVEDDPDLAHTITIDKLPVGESYEFKFRINGSWDDSTAEIGRAHV